MEPEQVLVLFWQIQDKWPYPRDKEHMNPHKILEDPPRRRVLYRCALLLRKGRPMVLESFAKAVLQSRIQQ
jgi:hypothetical protein